MMAPMLEACPSFQKEWDEFLSYWKDEPELPLYLALSSLVQHIIQIFEKGDFVTIEKVFAVVERWHLEGEWYVKEAATIGFLEDLQNKGLHKKTSPKDFERFLGPESLRWWKKLYDFWEHGKIITDD
jgi:hypothetical protein